MCYKYRFDKDGDPIECEGCGFPGLLDDFISTMSPNKRKEREGRPYWLCDLCASSVLGIVTEFGYQSMEKITNYQILKAINYNTNAILSRIEDMENERGD